MFSCVYDMYACICVKNTYALKIRFGLAVVIIAVLAPVLIGSLVSSNDVVFSNKK